jgi:hypothetical protein
LAAVKFHEFYPSLTPAVFFSSNIHHHTLLYVSFSNNKHLLTKEIMILKYQVAKCFSFSKSYLKQRTLFIVTKRRIETFPSFVPNSSIIPGSGGRRGSGPKTSLSFLGVKQAKTLAYYLMSHDVIDELKQKSVGKPLSKRYLWF